MSNDKRTLSAASTNPTLLSVKCPNDTNHWISSHSVSHDMCLNPLSHKHLDWLESALLRQAPPTHVLPFNQVMEFTDLFYLYRGVAPRVQYSIVAAE